MNNKKTIIWLVVGVLVVIGALVALIIYQSSVIKRNSMDMDAFKVAISNEMKVTRDKDGNEIAAVKSAVFASATEMKAAVEYLNKQGANIKSQVDGNTRSLILLDKTIGGKLEGKTTVSGYDTVKSTAKADSGKEVKVWPVYSINTTEKWYSLSGKVGHNGYQLTPLFYDSTEIKGQLVKNGFFKPRLLTASALSKNPYAKTTGLKSIVLEKQPAPVWGWVERFGLFLVGLYAGIKLF